jgi:hypothetical protein
LQINRRERLPGAQVGISRSTSTCLESSEPTSSTNSNASFSKFVRSKPKEERAY